MLVSANMTINKAWRKRNYRLFKLVVHATSPLRQARMYPQRAHIHLPQLPSGLQLGSNAVHEQAGMLRCCVDIHSQVMGDVAEYLVHGPLQTVRVQVRMGPLSNHEIKYDLGACIAIGPVVMPDRQRQQNDEHSYQLPPHQSALVKTLKYGAPCLLVAPRVSKVRRVLH